VTLTAYSDIVTNSIRASSNGGAGNTIKLTSLMGKIDTNGGLISSTSHAGGNAGAITLNSAKDIKVGDIFARSRDGEVATTGVWNGGKVTLEAGGDIEAGSITTTSIAGNAGNVTLEAGGDIEAGAIASNTFAGSGKGGTIDFVRGENIVVESLRADSIGGKGGDIVVHSNKYLQVTGSVLIGDEQYSVYTNSIDIRNKPVGANVLIDTQGTVALNQTAFVIGDASTNGTFGAVSDGVATFDANKHTFVSEITLNNIRIVIPVVVASNQSLPIGTELDKAIRDMLPFLTGISSATGSTLYDSIRLATSNLPEVTLAQVLQIAPNADPQKVSLLLPALNVAMAAYSINTPIRESHFFAQLLQESGEFNYTEEIASGNAYDITVSPILAAELGNLFVGDGKKYKGRGLIQITGRYVYTDFSRAAGLGDTLVIAPQLVATNPVLATLSAGYFWKIYKGQDLSVIADQDNGTNSETVLRSITTEVNGPLLSEGTPTFLSKRREYLAKAKQFIVN
ncbi:MULTISPECIES: glycoside hydrolase family 19 protein, partial [unclassified Microcystis]|uniref:glycoside hydrolase family 19 protein n=1 Tax=unclassified Microcystis TaxID=2643300 RepID=UPI00258ADE9D